MATIDDYLAYVSPEVEGCPRGVMIRELTGAAIQFCRKSHYIRKTLNITLVDGQRNYGLDLGADWETIEAVLVEYGAREVCIKGGAYLNYYHPGWRTEAGSEPFFCYLESAGTINVFPLPDAQVTGSIDVKCAVKPARSSTEWINDLYEDYVECIAHGAKGKLLAIKSGDWYDPRQASYCLSEFRKGYMDAKRRVFTGFSNEALYVDSITMGQQ